MKKSLLLISISVLTGFVSIAQKSTKIEIPFTMDRNLVLIKATIAKNQTHNFIFDTGTEGFLLLDSLASQFKTIGVDTIVSPQGEFVGTQSNFLIPKVKFGGLTLKKQKAGSMPRQMLLCPNAVGIIGMQTFVGYMITMDYTNSKIILQKGGLTSQANTIPINLDHILEAKVKLNGQEVLAHFDCGAPGYIAIPKGWTDKYKLKSEAVFMAKARTPMGDLDMYSADLDGDIEIGNYKIPNPKISLVTGDFFFAINFGYEFFKRHTITIDTKNKLLQIKNK